ncbi:MAG: AmpE protein [Paraglaciecola sp.]|jgi:AmpE protein
MTLISLLLVLFIERITTKSRYWQAEFYVGKYLALLSKRQWLSPSSPSWLLSMVILLPALILFIALHWFLGGVLGFVLSTAILMVCVGCPNVRASYKHFLQAADRGDIEASYLYAEQITGPEEEMQTLGQNLVWQNYQHYAAVILFFVAFGAAGALLYVIARGLQNKFCAQSPCIDKIMHILDSLPVRITALGFLLVGHFSRAFPIWLNHLLLPAVPAKTLLMEVCTAAEEIEPDALNCTEEPCTLVRLAKRNIMFLMVVISGLTLTGWLS